MLAYSPSARVKPADALSHDFLNDAVWAATGDGGGDARPAAAAAAAPAQFSLGPGMPPDPPPDVAGRAAPGARRANPPPNPQRPRHSVAAGPGASAIRSYSAPGLPASPRTAGGPTTRSEARRAERERSDDAAVAMDTGDDRGRPVCDAGTQT